MSKDRRPNAQDGSTIDWQNVKRILVIRLRSIGDTVLSTPSLIALRRFLPDAQIDVLLEDWVAPLLEDFDAVDNVVAMNKGTSERLKTAWQIRRTRYDVVFNLHGGTTATLLARASGAQHLVGVADYQYSFLYNHLLSSASEFWNAEKTHSAEQQLALLGFVGVPVDDRPRTWLAVSEGARESLAKKYLLHQPYALFHPTSLFATKRWSVDNFARVVEYLADRNIASIAVGSPAESSSLEELATAARSPVVIADDLSLPEIIALAAGASVFVGNDSGIAHIAAAVNTPTVVIFGSSNRNHWRPWTDAPNEIVFNPFECQPCPGYECKVYGTPKCIISVSPDQVMGALERMLAADEKGGPKPAFSTIK
jgi:heptosyltransferase-3